MKLVLFTLSLFLTLQNAHAAPLELQFWHSMTGFKGKLLSDIIDGFNNKPENRGKLRIVPQFVGSYEEGLNKLRAALLGGRGPHLVQITDIGERLMIDSGAVRPLQDFIDQDPEFPLSQILPPIRHYYEVNGKLYSLPFATSNPILYYNEDAFKKAGLERPPRTFAELEEWARKLTDPEKKRVGFVMPINSWFFEEFLARQGAPMTLPENGRKGLRPTEANYLCPEALGFVEFWARMNREGTFINLGRGWDTPEHNFLAGRAAMLITSTSDVFEVLQQAPFKLGIAAIPTRDPAIPGGTVVGGNSLWILNSKPQSEQKAAYQFVKYLAGAEVQENWHTHTGYFPIRGDVIDQLKARGFYNRFPGAYAAIEQLRAAPDLPATRGSLMGIFPEARQHVVTALEEVLSGQSDIPAALKRAKAKTDFSLKRYNRGKHD